MKIDELIDKLEQVKEEHGNLEVYTEKQEPHLTYDEVNLSEKTGIVNIRSGSGS